MSGSRQQQEGSGCAVLFVGLLVIAAVVAALISLAALVDPFSWLPPVDEIWEDCTDDYGTSRDECALENRFPGFWVHAIANLAYTLVAAGLLIFLGAAVGDLREARRELFSTAEARERHAAARHGVATAAVLVGLLALLPVVVAIA
jgi:hypothetical protein